MVSKTTDDKGNQNICVFGIEDFSPEEMVEIIACLKEVNRINFATRLDLIKEFKQEYVK